MSGEEEKSNQQIAFEKSLGGSSKPGPPRSIRARTGQTEDYLPEGKHVAEPV